MDTIFDGVDFNSIGIEMKIKKVSVAPNTLIAQYLPANYADAFECTIRSEVRVTPDDFMIAFWTYSPKWVEGLFKLRSWIVKPFGLDVGSDRNAAKLENAIRNGDEWHMRIAAKSENETVICADDKHLKFYFSIKEEEQEGGQKITATTVVHLKNCLGYAYFYTIMPFHHLVLRGMLKYAAKTLYHKV